MAAALNTDGFTQELQDTISKISNPKIRLKTALKAIEKLQEYYKQGRITACYAADGMFSMLDALPENERTIKRIQSVISFIKDARQQKKIEETQTVSLFEIALNMGSQQKKAILSRQNPDLTHLLLEPT